MEIQTTINFEEYSAVLKAMRKPRAKTGRRLAAEGLIGSAFGLLIVIGLQTRLHDAIILSSIIFGLLACLGWLWVKFSKPKCLRRSYVAQEKQLNGQIMEINQDGISGHWANGYASYRYAWRAFERLLDLPGSFVFLTTDISFVCIPKRSLTPNEQRELKEWAMSGIQKNKMQ